MKSIVKMELFRLQKSKSFWICFGLCVGLPILGFAGMLFLLAISNSVPLATLLRQLNVEGGAFMSLAEFVNYATDCNILAIICTATLLGREFRQGTIRNMVVANKSRDSIFLAFWCISLIVGTLFCLVSLVLVTVLYGAVIGFAELPSTTVFTNMLFYITMALTSTLFVQTLTCTFVVAGKKTSMAITLPILIIIFAPSVVSTVVTAVLAALVEDAATITNALQYLPFANWTFDVAHVSGANVGMIVLYNLLFTAICFVAGFFPFRKSALN